MPRGQLTFITETSEVLAKKLCKTLIRYHWIFKTRLTWKSELWSLNCCIYWTTVVISIKFAGYMKWTLSYEICKFGEYISYNSKDRIFPRGYFFGAPCTCREWSHMTPCRLLRLRIESMMNNTISNQYNNVDLSSTFTATLDTWKHATVTRRRN